MPDISHAGVAVTLGTYALPSTATVVLALRDARGSVLARCRFAPGTYLDNHDVVCPVRRASAVRGLVLSATGPGTPLAVYATARPGARPLAGALDRAAFSGGLVNGVRVMLSNLSGLRPELMPGWLAIAASTVSLMLVAVAVAVVLPRSRPKTSQEH
jgi:hypothetical protein